jgi:tyrosinase
MTIALKVARPSHEAADEFSRADLEFRGVDHSGPSFEARVYLDNPSADAGTGRDPASGYAGSFHVFGHGGCFGEHGHCDIPQGPHGPYDRRFPHQLTPQYKTVIVTDALRTVMAGSARRTLTVTVVPVVRDNPASRVGQVDDPLHLDSVSLITYEDPDSTRG